MPDKTVTFTLKNSDYDSVKKLYTNLSLPDIAFKGENNKIKLVALDKKNSNSNMYHLLKLILLILSLLLTSRQRI